MKRHVWILFSMIIFVLVGLFPGCNNQDEENLVFEGKEFLGTITDKKGNKARVRVDRESFGGDSDSHSILRITLLEQENIPTYLKDMHPGLPLVAKGSVRFSPDESIVHSVLRPGSQSPTGLTITCAPVQAFDPGFETFKCNVIENQKRVGGLRFKRPANPATLERYRKRAQKPVEVYDSDKHGKWLDKMSKAHKEKKANQ